MNNQELEKAYNIVFQDLISNHAPDIFQGIYDPINKSPVYMYGIGTVIEYIAAKSDKTNCIYKKFIDEFTDNMIQSEIYKTAHQ